MLLSLNTLFLQNYFITSSMTKKAIQMSDENNGFWPIYILFEYFHT